MNDSLLGQAPLFASLPKEELEHLAATLRPLHIPADAVLLREGEHGDRIYIVVEGEIEIVKALGTEDERLLRVGGPGATVGEMSLLNADGLRTASVRARTPTRVLEMTRRDLDELVRRQPAVAYDLARMLSARLQASDNATIRDLHEKNRELTEAYRELQAAQAQIIEKEALERELAVAREIQESMLPAAMPRLAGYEFGACMVPARAVGGDFYDFIPLDGDRLGIVVGDASGKGVPAALFMALTRSLLRAEAWRTGSPRETLRTVNWHLLEMNEAAMFVTVLYGVLDRATGQFEYARAGHELPLMMDARGAIQMPELGLGQPLGVFPDPALDEQGLAFPPGSALLLYSDGLTDAIDGNGALFGMERLQTAVSANRQASAAALCAGLVDAVTEYNEATIQVDDITVVAVRSIA